MDRTFLGRQASVQNRFIVAAGGPGPRRRYAPARPSAGRLSRRAP
jgi:hypothetical protein